MIFNWGNQFTQDGLDKTNNLLDTKKEIDNLIFVNSFVAATEERPGYINIKNLGPNEIIIITGYNISDNDGNSFEITLDSEIVLTTGAHAIIQINEILTGTKVSISLTNSKNYFTLSPLRKEAQSVVVPKTGNPFTSLESGYVPLDTEIILTPNNEDDIIYYTTDGTDPSPESSNKYGSSIFILEDTILKLIAIKEGYRNSNIVTYQYLIDGPKQLSLGTDHSCVVLESGKINCWGNNAKWQLGDGSQDDRSYPVLVYDINNAIEVTTGFIHSCALLETGEVMCWGANDFGQLGVTDKKKL